MIILPMFFFGLILAWKLKVDLSLWREKKTVNHSDEFWTVVVSMGATSGVILVGLSNSFFLSVFIVTGMLGSWFWLLFDGLYNKFRGYDWWYIGTDDPDDANLDNILQKLRPWQRKVVKIGLVSIFTFLYFNFLYQVR